MSATFTTSISTGQWFYVVDVNPNAAVVATIGSVALRVDAGNVSLWLNTNGATAWSTALVITSAGVVDLTSVTQLLLNDNSATALDIGSTGLLNLLRFVTTNGSEQVAYNGVSPFLINTGGLTVVAGTVSLPEASLNVASASTDAANNTVTAGLFLRATHGAGASTTNIVLPARVGGWRIVDAYIASGGAAAGSVQVQTAGGAANITNTMVPGAAAGDITRASNVSLTNGTVASGATIRLNVAAGALAGECFIRIEPL